ncbi:MAG: fibronectin type III domain-containing protein [Candidatus Eisenbacteria bacterium]|uniref:Fibronectin type III domain-containing protein n=1 Tax=Eiseniibacteriota bacterium TaxID=2212470 RepID=A0A956LZM8_UNCEI|nr:fibronectin type III domain-containing protein [Candidatus Eisenbacteria bacterium]
MAMMLEMGQLLQDRYRIDGLLGKGGMGAVYRAHDTRLNTTVAIKENLEFDQRASFETAPAPGQESSEAVDGRRAQFEREAHILARLRHEGLPKVTDHFLVPGQGQYLVMEFIHWKNLSEVMAERGRFDVDDALQSAIQVCRVLEYLHAQNPPIIHRDLKPANLRLTPDGRLIVVDFGIAKEGAAGLTRTGALGVTPGFSPVEQYAGSGQSDPRSDVYALGATLYAMLSGETPPAATDRFVGTPVIALKEKILGVSDAVQAAVDRAMSLNPGDRFPTATAFREALENARKGTAPKGATTGITAPIPRDSGGDDAAEQEKRRRSFFETPATGPMAPAVPPTAPVGSGVAGGSGSPAPTIIVDRTPTAPTADPGRAEKRGKGGLIAVLIVLVLAAAGFGAYRMGLFPKSTPTVPPPPTALWSAIEVHLSRDPNLRPSNATLLRRVDASTGAVQGHAPEALLADRTLAQEVFDGAALAAFARPFTADLECGQTYRVVAFGILADGSPERLGSAPFQSDPCPGNGPTHLSAKDIGPDRLTLTWDWTGPGFVAYEVHRTTEPSLTPTAATRTGNPITSAEAREVTVDELECDREYTFVLRAVTDEGSFDSPPLRVRTAACGSTAELPPGTPSAPVRNEEPRHEQPTSPTEPSETKTHPAPVTAPSDLSLYDATESSLDLRWAWNGPGFRSYDVYAATDRGFVPSAANHVVGPLTARDQTRGSVSGLGCGTTYFMRVRVTTTTGSADSPVLETRTRPCASAPSTPATPPTTPASPLAAVRIEAVEAKSGTLVEVRWTRCPSAAFSGYDIHLSVTSGFQPSSATKVQTVSMVDQQSLQLADLACNTSYYLRVVVRDIKGQSAVSDQAMVRTPACAIPNPVHLSPTGGDFPDLITAFERINQDPNVPPGLRIELAPGTYRFAGDLWLGKSVVLDGPQANVEGRIVLQAPRIELIGITLDTTGKSALNVPSGQLFLKDCVIQSRTHPGIEVLGNGSVELRNTTIRDCGSKGLLLRGNAKALVQGGSIEGNESGIDAGDQANLLMHGVKVGRSRQSGVYLHDGATATIDQGSAITGNGLNGILVAASAQLTLTGSSVRENSQAGVIVEAGGTVRLRDCDLTGNVQDALVEDSGSSVTKEGNVRTK